MIHARSMNRFRPALVGILATVLFTIPGIAAWSSGQPALSGVEGPALSDVEGPALSDVEGPALSDVEGPALSGVEGQGQGDAGGAAFQRVCSNCHPITRVTATRRSHAQWEEVIETMINARGAKVTDEEFETILGHLVREYGRVSVNSAAADERSEERRVGKAGRARRERTR